MIETILGLITLILVGIQVWIFRRQTRILENQRQTSEDQLKYQIRKEGPRIDVQSPTYDGDKIKFCLYNGGKTEAIGVALKTEVHLIKPEMKKEGDRILMFTRGDWDFQKQHDFTDGEKNYSLRPIIREIFHEHSNYPELELNQSREFEQEVWFGLFEKKSKFSTASKNVTFKHLLTLLKANNVLGCEIKISLIYKDLMNKVVEEVKIDEFYIMPSKLKPKFLSELTEKDKPTGGMRLVPIHPFRKQEYGISKPENLYRDIDHYQR